jgi:hypothetical protein
VQAPFFDAGTVEFVFLKRAEPGWQAAAGSYYATLRWVLEDGELVGQGAGWPLEVAKELDGLTLDEAASRIKP